ncbi:MAG: zinc ribbon domain-containing protein [bacterium]
MNDLERMYRQLVRTIRANFPQYLTQPFEVGELYSTILPYRLHRRELGLETNQDYELALMELLSGAHGYLVVDDKMRDVLTAERGATTPDAARLREFAASHIALAPEALQQLESSSRTPDSRASGATSRPSAGVPQRTSSGASLPGTGVDTAGATSASASASASEPARHTTRPITVPETGEPCAFCAGALPPGRTISFCPHCGQDLTVVHCPACGSELERGWKFCVTCGRAADKVR